MDAKQIKVMIVDDNTEFLATAVQYFKSRDFGITVVTTAHNGLDALELTAEHNPDVVLMDIEMPKLNGFTATEIIKKMDKPPKIITISIFASPFYEQRARSSGADNFISKMDFGEKIVPMIKSLIN